MNLAQASKGFAYSLALLPWDCFATLTFEGSTPIERRGWRMAWRHLHGAAEALEVPYGKLLIALRSERGELGDRFHFHYLLGRTGAGSNPHSLAFRLAYLWKRQTGGHAVVRPYDSRLAGADYIEGCLSGGNLYELGKFNRSDRLELSASVFRAVRLSLRYTCEGTAPGKAGLFNTGDAESPAL